MLSLADTYTALGRFNDALWLYNAVHRCPWPAWKHPSPLYPGIPTHPSPSSPLAVQRRAQVRLGRLETSFASAMAPTPTTPRPHPFGSHFINEHGETHPQTLAVGDRFAAGCVAAGHFARAERLYTTHLAALEVKGALLLEST